MSVAIEVLCVPCARKRKLLGGACLSMAITRATCEVCGEDVGDEAGTDYIVRWKTEPPPPPPQAA
ncbi:MAG: hypothetical protein ACYDH4_09915 [Candidatus Cryosericum sp.]